MICKNCGANIDKNEEYCPSCGMELLNSPTKKKYQRGPEPIKHENSHFKSSKKKYYGDPESFSPKSSHQIEKPIKQKYYNDSLPVSPDYSHYDDEIEYEEAEAHEEDYYEEDYKEKSGVGIGNIILFLFIALILGFVVGLFMFGSQSVPQIPGFKI